MEKFKPPEIIVKNIEKNYDPETKKYLASLFNQIDQVGPKFFLFKLEQTNYHFEFMLGGIIEMSQSLQPKDKLKEITGRVVVTRVNNDGNETQLGEILRDPENHDVVEARLYNNKEGNLSKRIHPGDNGWNSIVGSAEIAAKICQKDPRTYSEMLRDNFLFLNYYNF